MAVDSGTVQVVMPAMGDSVAEGTVLEWRKGVGDHVEADETIVEISTDKVDAEVPAPASGTLAKILVAEGDEVLVGAVLAEIAVDGDGRTATGDGNADAATADGDGNGPQAAGSGPVSAESPPVTEAEAQAAAGTEQEHAPPPQEL